MVWLSFLLKDYGQIILSYSTNGKAEMMDLTTTGSGITGQFHSLKQAIVPILGPLIAPAVGTPRP